MTIFSVLHKTVYRYKNPVRLGLHELLVRPRDSFDQRLLDCRLKVTPAPSEVRWIHDVFGNCVTLVTQTMQCWWRSWLPRSKSFRSEEHGKVSEFGGRKC